MKAKQLIRYAGQDDEGAWYEPSSLAPRQEEVLSYFTGLAPVGEPFEANRATAIADLGFRGPWSYQTAIVRLIRNGFIKRLSPAYRGSSGVFVVLRRLEPQP